MDDSTERWDPIKSIQTDIFDESRTELLRQVNFYKKYPYIIKLIFFMCCCLVIAAVLFVVFIKLEIRLTVLIIGISVLPFVYYYKSITSLQNELILYFLCQKNNWIYNPKLDTEDVDGFVMNYPAIFDKGHSSSLEDQVWGNLSNDHVDFWKGLFNYTEGYGRDSHTYQITVFALKLKAKIRCPFSLDRAGVHGDRSDIKTESVEFNSLFNIKVENTGEEQEVIRLLSPSVQVRLIDFGKKYMPDTIYFKDDVMLIVFGLDILKTKYTNFIKKVMVDERDENIFYTALSDMAQLPSEMIQFID